MQILGRCCCPGRYQDRCPRWRVLKRTERSLLYCLDCRRQWRSGAWYIALLRDHKPRSRSGLTDAEILARIQDGSLQVDTHRGVVRNRQGKALAVFEREHPEGPQRGTYRFVSVCSNGKKKKIALHRLVWMAANGRTVPDGYDIDHIASQTDDTIQNLRLLESAVNRATAGKPQPEEAW